MRKYLCIAFVAMMCFLTLGARANPVLPGQTTAPDAFIDVSGTVEATFTGSYVGFASGKLEGDFIEYVVRDAVTNNLDFVYQFRETGGADPVGRITADNYKGWATDVGFATTLNLALPAFGLGTALPVTVDRSGNGDVIGFNLDKTTLPIQPFQLAAGNVSELFVIKTNANLFAPNNTQLIDGTVAIAAPTVGPAVPLPAVAWAGLPLLGGLGLTRLRRRS